ncbi:MAG: trifunctional transcriptional activator/DNA repair protein Ada/methylated-DNA--[protein]-cysteine S-methyltransferase [Acidobacteriota bacterium]
MIVLPPQTEMDTAFGASDASYDGIFFVAVTTTGIFCRPSCPARKPLPRNVRYFATAREALFAGFRPCKRCRPLETDGRPPEWVRDLMARVDGDPETRLKDADLRSLGHDPAQVRRTFQKHYAMTFQAYCRSRRLGRAFEQIRKGADLDDVALGHGFGSHSGFRDAFARTFGRPPGKARAADCIVAAWIETPLGPMVAGATGDAVCLLEFTDRRMLEAQLRTLQARFKCAAVPGWNRHIAQLQEEMGQYFAGALRRFTVPLRAPGTPFQQRVWDELLRIPYGETLSYEALAQAVGSPGACRAVGTANGLNRIAIVIPCHRVVNKNGKLGGYGGGLWRKQRLLDLERGQEPLAGLGGD